VICLSFDNLGAAAEGGPPDPGHPSLRVGLPRILALLAELRLPATFFVEGWNGEAHPDAVASIAAAGHEVALHAWRHERWGDLQPVRESDLLARGVAALAAACGRAPRGFRPPGGRLTGASATLLPEHGIEWVSTSAGEARGLPGAPFRWEHVEATNLVREFGGRAEAEPFFTGWLRDARAHEAATPEVPLVFVAHPFCAGVDPYWDPFERWVRAVCAEVPAASFGRIGRP
jgi:peptidoglycan/xylan/chitin deacetylase (PgdA/CDA1 family)